MEGITMVEALNRIAGQVALDVTEMAEVRTLYCVVQREDQARDFHFDVHDRGEGRDPRYFVFVQERTNNDSYGISATGTTVDEALLGCLTRIGLFPLY
jgi:hypothetical protein